MAADQSPAETAQKVRGVGEEDFPLDDLQTREPHGIRRRFLPDGVREELDSHGFLDIARTPGWTAGQLLAHAPVVVWGQPWLGKTHVSREIEAWLTAVVGGRVSRTHFAGPQEFRAGLLPSWWHDWGREPAMPAHWVIDGLDEGLDGATGTLRFLVESFGDISPAHLQQLRLVIFSRRRLELRDYVLTVRDQFAAVNVQMRQCSLARWDRDTARQHAGAGVLARVEAVVAKNRLRDMAGLPAVFRHLRDSDPAETVTAEAVWRGVLRRLVDEPEADRRASLMSELEDRFDAAARIGAVLTLTGHDVIRRESDDAERPAIDNVFPLDGGRHRAAARDACRFGAFVGRPEQDVWQFQHRNVQDWFAAFGLLRLAPAALTQAFAGADRQAFPRHTELLRLMRAVAPDAAVRAAIDAMFGGITYPSDNVTPDLALVRACLDHLERAAAASTGFLAFSVDDLEKLQRLACDGLGRELCDRLGDNARTPEQVDALLTVAEETNSGGMCAAALAIATDGGRPMAVRDRAGQAAGRLAASETEWAALREFSTSTPPDAAGAVGRASAMYHLFRQKQLPLTEMALAAPPAGEEVDVRGMVLISLEKHMTAECARALWPHFPALMARHASPEQPGRPPDFLQRAFEVLLEDGVLSPQDRLSLGKLLLSLLGRWPARDDWASMFVRAFRADQDVRRLYYLSDVNAWRADAASRPRWGVRVLDVEDWPWLRGLAAGDWAAYPPVWDHLYVLGRHAGAADRAAASEWDRRRADLEEACPGLDVRVSDATKAADAREAQIMKKEGELANRPPTPRLQDLVEQGLAQEGRDVTGVLVDVAAVCFGQEWLRGRVDGTWDALPPDLQARVLSAVRGWLDDAVPAAYPAGPQYSVAQLAQGAAFTRVLSDPATPPDWVTDQRVRRWLPYALLFPRDDEYIRLLRRCHQAAPAATEDAVIGVVRAEAATSEYLVRLQWVPDECWTDAFASSVLRLVQDGDFPAVARAAALRIASRHAPPAARLIADLWADGAVASAPAAASPLRAAARDVLLAVDPDAALAMIERDLRAGGSVVLEELEFLYRPATYAGPHPAKWPLARRASLLQLLLRTYPRRKDPKERWGFMTPKLELLSLRDQLLDQVLGADSPEADDVVDKLVKADKSLKPLRDRRLAAKDVTRLLGGPPPPATPPTAVSEPAPDDASRLSLRDVLALLDRADYRLLRNEDDLLDVVLDVLGAVGKDAAEDLDMLYESRTRGGPRVRLHEKALQAYVRRRLRDLLLPIVNSRPFEALREDQVLFGDKLDIRVVAPVRSPQGQAQLVIEVKWSDNKDTRHSLVSQLGRRYLRRPTPTRGIYLVGWAGGWTPPKGVDSSRDGLAVHLVKQAAEFTGEGKDGNGCRIVPFILDLAFPRRAGPGKKKS